MEQLHSNLHETYKNLKKRKFFEEDAKQKKSVSTLQSYQQDVEDLLDMLNSEKYRLSEELSSLQKKYEEKEKLLLEKDVETKDLSSEVERLEQLLAKKDEQAVEANQNVTPGKSRTCAQEETDKNEQAAEANQYVTPGKSHRLSRSTCAQEETDKNVEHIIQQETVIPSCSKRTLDNGGDMKDLVSSVFHTLVESVLDMRVSIDSQSEEESCLSLTHEKSGYSFSLTWPKNGGELTYRVSSLGTLEKVALRWMKEEEIVFNMNMCPVFFNKLTRVIVGAIN